MFPFLRTLACSAAVVFGGVIPAAADDPVGAAASYTAKPVDGGLTVERNGEVVAGVVARSGSKPIIWPLIGPDGVEMSRRYPMVEAGAGEAEDHIHHRSLWFTHGDVNGIDFWAEGDKRGQIVQRSASVDSGDDGLVVLTENDWIGPDGQRTLSDHRRIRFHDVGETRAIDFEITLAATDGPVNFGDTKEGSFGIRVAASLKVDAGKGGKIMNSRGDQDGAAWGKPAEWVDYTGPIGDKTYGIAIFNHPSSFGFPSHWHVRTYGLFAANPFGVSHFTGGEPTKGISLADGESLTLRYRVLLHKGDTEQAKIGERWTEYSESEQK